MLQRDHVPTIVEESVHRGFVKKSLRLPVYQQVARFNFLVAIGPEVSVFG